MPGTTIPETVPHSHTICDDDAQLQSSQGYTSGGSPVAAEQLGFVYDAGFSMTERSVNGTATTYTVNDLNEATSDGANSFAYDANGNMTSGNNGHNAMVYDDENRLVQWFYYTNSASQPINGDLRTDFVYDGLGRLRKRLEYLYSVMTNSPGGGDTDTINPGVGTDSFEEPPPQPVWTLLSEVRYIYDSKRVIQERDSNNVPVVTYTRGKDLSGTLEGAGGIGGLLARSSGYSSGTWQTHNYYFSDGSGNVTCLRGYYPSTLARYRYDAYGRTLDSSGDLANANVYRFSSKEIHVNSGMYYYLYRFYNPNLQRWLNRDPLGEAVDPSLYRFVRNDPLNGTDFLGLADENPICVVLTALIRGGNASEGIWGLYVSLGCHGGPPMFHHPERPRFPFRPPNYSRFDPSVNRWSCIAGGPPVHVDHPFQFPELEPGDKIAAVGAGLILLLPFALPEGGAGGLTVIVTAPIRFAPAL